MTCNPFSFMLFIYFNRFSFLEMCILQSSGDVSNEFFFYHKKSNNLYSDFSLKKNRLLPGSTVVKSTGTPDPIVEDK